MYLLSARVVERKKSNYKFSKKLNFNTETGGELFPYPRRFNGSSSDLQNRRFENENNFGDTDAGYDDRGSDIGSHWYSSASRSSKVENKWFGGSGNGSGSGDRSGNRFGRTK